MGHSYRREGVKGKPRYAAIYHDPRGRRRSAGTFATKREADRAWAAAEADALLGHGRDPRRGKITFNSYVTGSWLPNHQLEATTRQRYTYQIDKHLMPEFGAMRMSRHRPRPRPRLDHPTQRPRRLRLHHRRPQDDPVRDLHHRPQRPGRPPAPLPRRQDPDRARSSRASSSPRNSSTLIHPALPETAMAAARRDSRSNPGCAGANSPNYARATSTPRPGCSPSPAPSSRSTPRFRPTGDHASSSRTTRRTRNTGGSSSPPRSRPCFANTSSPTASAATTCSSPLPDPEPEPDASRRRRTPRRTRELGLDRAERRRPHLPARHPHRLQPRSLPLRALP